MANYNSQYTGAEVDAAVGKANAIPSATDINDTVSRALKTPIQVLQNNELVGLGIDGSQIRVQLGEGLTLEGTTSPFTLKASGGGGAQLYEHNIMCFCESGEKSGSKMFFSLILNDNTPITSYTTLYTILNTLGFNNNNQNYESLKSATGVHRSTGQDDEFIMAVFRYGVGSNNFLGFVSNRHYGQFGGASSTVRIIDKVVTL